MVGKDLFVTAGHCLVEPGETVENTVTSHCQENSWLFDYKASASGKTDLKGLNPDTLYGCKEVLFATWQEDEDYAVIRLDREVVGRRPLELRRSGEIRLSQEIFVIGHPTGLPMKYASEAKVFTKKSGYFSTNLDTFGGNSGSPVFNAETMIVEGILVRGDEDYYLSEFQGERCMRPNKCDQNRKNCIVDDPRIDGEHVSKISRILKYLN